MCYKNVAPPRRTLIQKYDLIYKNIAPLGLKYNRVYNNFAPPRWTRIQNTFASVRISSRWGIHIKRMLSCFAFQLQRSGILVENN